ncbi:MAG: LAGLIDADG family homing endonuclease, partial [Candidatus Levybacteria bacterium]|nr:LAGLIDADG family homing endonuclease [Candidatus Levybacteria bacterium]
MKLDGIRQKVFLDRYSLKDKKGNPMEETPDKMWARVAKGVSQAEGKKDQKKWEKKFYEAMQDFKFVPGGRILAGAGTGFDVTFYNCFVLPSPKDSRDGILDNLKQMIEIMARGGGAGINISSLRPKGARVKKVNGFSSGPCNWAELYSLATHDIIQQGGSRRGALMLMLWDWHPDIEEFITIKQDLKKITGANLSVCVSDKFMEAVKKDADWDLVFPDLSDKNYDEKWDGILNNWKAAKKKVKVYKTVKARYLWNLICEAAWRSAEPGIVFMERYNKWYNNWYWNTVNCTNPCVTGDTLVATSKGLIAMEELYSRKQPFVAVVEGRRYLSSSVRFAGVKKVYQLKTKEGYELRLTADHKVFTTKGKIEAGKLEKGDKICLSYGPAFGLSGNLEQGRVLGWLVGDGSVKEDVATLFFYGEEKTELAPNFALMVEEMVEGEQLAKRAYSVRPQYIDKEDKAVVESVRLWRIVNSLGLTHQNKYKVPNAVLIGSEALQRGFLQGLFSSDGSVQGTLEKGLSVRLTSVSKELLINTQRILLNFGIASKIYYTRRKEEKRFLPDGKGGKKLYDCKEYHELVISKEGLVKFAAVLGFLQKAKQEKLASLLTLYQRGPYNENFTAMFESLKEDGVEKVYDITVDNVHRFSANGFLISNCGEEGLPSWGVCNLSSLNLSAFVKGYTVDEQGEMDYKSLAEHAKMGVR